MGKFIVTGGKQGSLRPLFADDFYWYDYAAGLILQVDTEVGRVEKCVEYVTPPTARAENGPVIFKSSAIAGNTLYVCTQTEVLIYCLPDFRPGGYLSLPCFNDLHHVTPSKNGNLLLANSGLEMVMEVQPDGGIVNLWNVLGEDPWERFSPEIDYRMGVNTKPRRAHPNFVFTVGEEVWATRFEKRDAICLTRPDKRIPVEIERVHDGVVHQGSVFFTTVNGNIVRADPHAQKVVEVWDLNRMHPDGSLLGWCRGLYLEGSKAWVGFSRVRPTRFREALSWVRQGFNLSYPTHIACYDLEAKVCLQEINLEEYGIHALFSILPLSPCPLETH